MEEFGQDVWVGREGGVRIVPHSQGTSMRVYGNALEGYGVGYPSTNWPSIASTSSNQTHLSLYWGQGFAR